MGLTALSSGQIQLGEAKSDRRMENFEGSSTLHRKALGRSCALGELYCGPTDAIMKMYVLREEAPPAAVQSLDIPQAIVRFDVEDNYNERSRALEVGGDLNLSVLLNLVSVGGSGSYLTDTKKSSKTVRCSILYTIVTKEETLNLSHPEVGALLEPKVLENSRAATHMVAGIKWGACGAFVFEKEASTDEEKRTIKASLKLSSSLTEAFTAKLNLDSEPAVETKNALESFSVRLIADVIPEGEDVPRDFDSAVEFARKLPSRLREYNGGKGKPLELTLLPLEMIAKFWAIDLARTTVMTSISKMTMSSVVQEIGMLLEEKEALELLYREVEKVKDALTVEEESGIRTKLEEVESETTKFFVQMSKCVVDVRSGIQEEHVIENTLESFLQKPYSSKSTKAFLQSQEKLRNKIDFLKSMKVKGVECIGRESRVYNPSDNGSYTYILCYRHKDRLEGSTAWTCNHSLFNDLVDKKPHGQETKFCLLDYDVCTSWEGETGAVSILQYRGGARVSVDYYKIRDRVNNREMNILLLGQSGVGKTTFINALKNHLSCRTFEDAKNAPLHVAIPSSFTVVDEVTKERVKVTVGGNSSEDEFLGDSGEAGTRRCMVHVFPMKDMCRSTIKIIDTPGIGDGEGVEKDKANFQNVLSELEKLNYPHIHGICILLKANEARMSFFLEYCITELLTYLHRNATPNVVFCFTNTRGTDYSVGDSFAPLQKLLKNLELKGTVIPLTEATIYCFDSESFRFFAAREQNVSLSERNARESWMHNENEYVRLLSHLANIKAHMTEETLCLNKVKQIVTNLEEPMRKLSSNIKTNLKEAEKHKSDIAESDASILYERQLLNRERKVVRFVKLKDSRTVCVSPKCGCYVVTEDGRCDMVHCVDPCHSPCGLHEEGWFGPYWCRSMNFLGNCKKCGCKSRDHKFVNYETIEETIREQNPDAAALLDKHQSASDGKAKLLEVVNKHVEDLQKELKFVNDAEVKFACFLKKNTIRGGSEYKAKHIQDAISVLESKLEDGGDTVRRGIEKLKKQLDKHRKDVQDYEEFLSRGDNQQEISLESMTKVISDLYNLPITGDEFRNAQQILDQAHSCRRREIVHDFPDDSCQNPVLQTVGKIFATGKWMLTSGY